MVVYDDIMKLTYIMGVAVSAHRLEEWICTMYYFDDFVGNSTVVVIGPLKCSVDRSGSTLAVYIQPTFNSTFNYTIAGPHIKCPQRCRPITPCRCIVVERHIVNVSITALDQVGPPANLTIATGKPILCAWKYNIIMSKVKSATSS